MDKKVKLSLPAINAAFHCVQNTEAKGRANIRKGKKITQALRSCCMKESPAGIDANTGQELSTVTLLKDSYLVLDEEVMDHLADTVDNMVEHGFKVFAQGKYETVLVPGALHEGYDDLQDALEAQEKVADKVVNEVAEQKAKAS